MNRSQKLVVVAGIAIAALMGLFPPWSRFLPGGDQSLGSAGYHFFFITPGPGPDSFALDDPGVFRVVEEARIDAERLLYQLAFVAAATVLGVLSLGRRHERAGPAPDSWSYHRSRHFDADD